MNNFVINAGITIGASAVSGCLAYKLTESIVALWNRNRRNGGITEEVGFRAREISFWAGAMLVCIPGFALTMALQKYKWTEIVRGAEICKEIAIRVKIPDHLILYFQILMI